MMDAKYEVNISWDDEADEFVATFPDFPYLSAFGKTWEEAVTDAHEVMGMALNSFAERGITPPAPQRRQMPATFSGQFRVRLPKSLHAELAAMAEDEGVSLNTVVVSLLSGQNKINSMYRDIQNKFQTLMQAHSSLQHSIHRHISTSSSDDYPEFTLTPAVWGQNTEQKVTISPN